MNGAESTSAAATAAAATNREARRRVAEGMSYDCCVMPSVTFRYPLAIAVALAIAAAARPEPAAGARTAIAPQPPAAGGPRIEVSFAQGARAEAVTGMVYVAISRDNQHSPIEQADPQGVPLFSKYVEGLAPGAAAVFTG